MGHATKVHQITALFREEMGLSGKNLSFPAWWTGKVNERALLLNHLVAYGVGPTDWAFVLQYPVLAQGKGRRIPGEVRKGQEGSKGKEEKGAGGVEGRGEDEEGHGGEEKGLKASMDAGWRERRVGVAVAGSKEVKLEYAASVGKRLVANLRSTLVCFCSSPSPPGIVCGLCGNLPPLPPETTPRKEEGEKPENPGEESTVNERGQQEEEEVAVVVVTCQTGPNFGETGCEHPEYRNIAHERWLGGGTGPGAKVEEETPTPRSRRGRESGADEDLPDVGAPRKKSKREERIDEIPMSPTAAVTQDYATEKTEKDMECVEECLVCGGEVKLIIREGSPQRGEGPVTCMKCTEEGMMKMEEEEKETEVQ